MSKQISVMKHLQDVTIGGRGLAYGPFYFPVVDSITAYASGGQTNATALDWGRINRISVCATPGDSVKITADTIPGAPLKIRNDGAESCNVYPPSGGQINALGANNPYALASGATVEIIPFSGTQYYTY